jgi:hypothetical protein
VLDQAVAEETSLTLLRTCLMNPFLHDWNERTPPFTKQFVDYLHEVALEEYLEHVIPPVQSLPAGGRLRVLVVESSPDAPDALTHPLRTHDTIAARVNVHAMTPSALQADDEIPTTAQKAVIHADGLDGDTLRAMIHRLQAEANLSPQRIIVLGADLLPNVTDAAHAAGLPATNLLADADADRQLKRLLPRLYSHLQPDAAPS